MWPMILNLIWFKTKKKDFIIRHQKINWVKNKKMYWNWDYKSNYKILFKEKFLTRKFIWYLTLVCN